jgi:hypothetical protein
VHFRKKLKVLGAIFAVFLIVAMGILLSLPSILSTNVGKNQAVKLINSQIPGSFTVESVSLSWIGSQIFKGVTLKGLEGDTVLSFDSFRTETPLIKFLFSGPTIGKTELKNFNMNIVEEYPEVTNFQQALGKKQIQFKRKKNDVIIRLPLAEIALKSKKARNFRKPESIKFEHVDLMIDSATFEKPIVFHAKGETKQGDLAGSFDIDATFLSGMAQRWQFNKKANVAVKANITNFPVDMLDIALTLDQPELHGIMRDVMGDRITVNVDQSLSQKEGAFLIKTESPTFNINLIAGMEQGKYILRNAGKISFLITPEFFERIASRGRTTSLLRLVKPTQTSITIDDLAIPIDYDDQYPNALNFAALSMHAKLDSQELTFTGSPFWGEVAIREITSTLETNEASRTAVWRLRGEADQNGQHIPIKLDATIYKPNFGENFFESIKKQTDIHIQLAGVPLVKLDQEFQTKPLLASLFGTKASMEMKYDPKMGAFSGVVWSDNKIAAIPRLEVSGSVKEDQWLFDLNGKTAKKGSIAGHMEWHGKNVAADLSADHLTLVESTYGSSCEIHSLKLNVAGDEESMAYDFKAHTSSIPNKGTIAFQAKFGKESDFYLHMHETPLAQLCAFFVPNWKVHKKISALFGEKVNVAMQHTTQKVALHVEGPNGRVVGDGFLKDDLIHLSKPLEGEFIVTPHFGPKVLADLVPIFRSVIATDAPISLKIEPDGFTCPLKNFAWEKVNFDKGVIHLGKTLFQMDREINSLLDLLETDAEETVPIWFTPTYFSMDKGVVRVERFDMLLMQNLPLAAWGDVDMVNNKLKMTLGLTKETLNKAFQVDFLDDSFVMHLPIEGNLERASLHKGKAALSISSLITKQDPLVEQLMSVIGISSGKTPNPTTNPLPWK